MRRCTRPSRSAETAPTCSASIDDEAPVHRAPISAEHRAQATAIGQWASDTATQALASVLAPQPQHRGRPSDMIASLATGIALEMGLPREEIERIRIASLLHDLGKIAIPEEILDKPSTLSDTEWQTIGEHPRIGQVILEQASSLREAIPVVLHHHERFNGGGYPHGLRGAEIPLGARIVAVADAYHAMVHERPYSAALDHEQALEELAGPRRDAVRPEGRRGLLRCLLRRRPARRPRGGLPPPRARAGRAAAPRRRGTSSAPASAARTALGRGPARPRKPSAATEASG